MQYKIVPVRLVDSLAPAAGLQVDPAERREITGAHHLADTLVLDLKNAALKVRWAID